MSKKRLRLFLLLVVISVLLMTYQSQKGILRPFGFLSHGLNSLNNAIVSLTFSVEKTFKKFTLREKELEDLRNELQQLKQKEQAFEEVFRENQRLRQLLSLKKRERKYVATARVIARGSDRWTNTFIIDKGRKDSIKKNMTVITPEGLLGKIQEVEDSYSSVLLIDDPRFSAAVRLQGSRTEAVLSGTGTKRLCKLKYVSTDTRVAEGEIIVTSGLDSLFPPGIKAGYISKISTDEEKLFHDIQVIPFVDTTKVEEVIIIKR
jgi:rod shape-determining protein MreC